ncbi:MAG: 30S ribosomal protein S2 [Sphingobacteriales bacterium]|nr:MAG: 30S ribosomal protein S2 [Sphingobacteriales bacterium]
MARTTYQDLLDAGVHFGHLTRKWNPKMAQYIFMERNGIHIIEERNGIHIIDLNKTLTRVDEAASAIKQIVKSGRKILFVATKKQAKDIVAEYARSVNMPYVTERWLGGMLTNFATVRKSIKKMTNIDKMTKDGTYDILSKKEKLMIQRERIKLETLLGGIADLNRLPAALFLIDVKKEHIAVTEALKLNIPTFAMVDTNSDPSNIDFPIPANDDATKSISLIAGIVIDAIKEGLEERKQEKDAESDKEAAAEKAKVDAPASANASGERTATETGKRVRKGVETAVAEEVAIETPIAEAVEVTEEAKGE